METKKDIQWLRNSHSLIRGNFPVFLKETLLVLEEIFLYVITNYVCVCVCVMFVYAYKCIRIYTFSKSSFVSKTYFY